jgi:2,4-dienoyl-CoA reductase-like NADH-dependent reductase (Old Yellow Enzyme family)/NADPH-dependent 2,4-dienoyl-CoA reductase/sulfur reductase-like enzyme
MTSDSRQLPGYPHLRQPLGLGPCHVKNRVARAAHTTGLARRLVTPQLVDYHEARARGDVGLHIIDAAGVHSSSPATLVLTDDDVIPGLRQLSQAIQRHGGRVFQQLWHAGPQAALRDSASPWAPSIFPSPRTGRMTRAMSRNMIDVIVEAYAAAAARCVAAGMDGVEVHAGHGYLLCSFLSPATNRRDDDYGGSPENRLRFLTQVLRAVRDTVPATFAVAVRLSCSEGLSGGLEVEDTVAIAQYLERQALIDVISISMGGYYDEHLMMASMSAPLGYQLPSARKITEAVASPTIVTGRVMTAHDAERIVAEGIGDVVSMVRATIADPDLLKKSFEGRPDRVRPCISCNQGCVEGLLGHRGKIGCAVNPDVGDEHRSALTPVGRPRKVLVVGGGPAGLEAAWTAAQVGHDVTLVEASHRLGGQVELARRAPHRGDIGEITDWLARELTLLGVTIKTGHVATAPNIDERNDDVVVIATGSDPACDGVQRYRPGLAVSGLDRPHVVAPHDVLANLGRPGARALIFDDGQSVGTPSVVEYLLEHGCPVTYATSSYEIGGQLKLSLQQGPLMTRLARYDEVRLLTRMALVAVDSAGAWLEGLDDHQRTWVDAELVVVDFGAIPRTALVDELSTDGRRKVVVGDAAGSTTLQAAIAAGRRAGRAVS